MEEMAQYLKHYFGDRKNRSSFEEADSLENWQGSVFDRNGEKIAVYRDGEGQLHAVSAVCRHLKCIVGWNASEHTWDCPCHGSRYQADGKVIHGPAKKDLPAITI